MSAPPDGFGSTRRGSLLRDPDDTRSPGRYVRGTWSAGESAGVDCYDGYDALNPRRTASFWAVRARRMTSNVCSCGAAVTVPLRTSATMLG